MNGVMSGGEIVAVVAIVFGSTYAMVMGITRRVFGDGRTGRLQAALHSAEERNQLLELQLAESRRENESLHKQLEWHSKLLAAQDNLVKQLAPASAGNGPLSATVPSPAPEPPRAG